MYTLVVVDMQTHFVTTENLEFTKNIQREINQAVQDEAQIVFVEYSGSGETLQDLVSLTKDYYRKHTIAKYHNDGSSEIQSLVEKESLSTDFKVVGVNTDFCVKETVQGLSKKFPKGNIDVLWDCCASLWYSRTPTKEHHLKGISKMAELPNVAIKNEPVKLEPGVIRAIQYLLEA